MDILEPTFEEDMFDETSVPSTQPEQEQFFKQLHLKAMMNSTPFRCAHCNKRVPAAMKEFHCKRCQDYWSKNFGSPAPFVEPSEAPKKRLFSTAFPRGVQAGNGSTSGSASGVNNDNDDGKEEEKEEEWPLSEPNYFMASTKRKKAGKKKKSAKACMLTTSEGCTYDTTTPRAYVVVIGDQKYVICSHTHLADKKLCSKILQKMKDVLTETKKAVQDRNQASDFDEESLQFVCSRPACNDRCDHTYQLGGRDTAASNRMNFCKFEHLWEYMKNTRAVDWKTFVNNSKSQAKPSASAEIEEALASQGMVD